MVNFVFLIAGIIMSSIAINYILTHKTKNEGASLAEVHKLNLHYAVFIAGTVSIIAGLFMEKNYLLKKINFL